MYACFCFCMCIYGDWVRCTDFRILNQQVTGEGWLILTGITTLLAAVTLALLVHLLFFHFWLSKSRKDLLQILLTYHFVKHLVKHFVIINHNHKSQYLS